MNAWWCNDQGVGLRGCVVQFPAVDKLFTHVPLSPHSVIWYQLEASHALRLGR